MRYFTQALLASASLSLLSSVAFAEQTTSDFHPAVSNEWFISNNCNYYQNKADTVFVCNDAEVYVLPRDRSFADTDTLVNIYDPSSFDLNGKVLRVFPEASPSHSQMFFLDTHIDPVSLEEHWVTVEQNGETVRPVFDLAASLETGWFKLSVDQTWFLFKREGDDYLALMEVDMNAADYLTAAGSLNGKYVKPVDVQEALVLDFNAETSIMSHLNPDRTLHMEQITKLNGGNFKLEIEQLPLSDRMRQALEINDDADPTRFASFQRYGDFWVFGDDQNGAQKVTVLAEGANQVIEITQPLSDVVEFGRYVWISSDNDGDASKENIIIAISAMTSIAEDNIQGKIEFHRLVPTTNSDSSLTYNVYRLSNEIEVTDVNLLNTATFNNGDFLWQSLKGNLPSQIKVCPQTHFVNSETHLCEACPSDIQGTSQLMQSNCVSCGTMWWYELQTQGFGSSIEYAIANKLCDDPEAIYREEVNSGTNVTID